jgi:biopolymer transport protein ExbD
MRRRFAEEEDELEGEDELNLTPYLDVITTLVIFFVFTFQIVIEFRLIDVMPPEISTKTDSSSDPSESVKVSLFVTPAGFLIDATGQQGGTPVASRAVIPKKADGAYDTALLHQRAVELKGATHAGESLILVAHEAVEYKDVVAAMDAVRSTDKGLLFPDVVFGEPVGDATPVPAPAPGGTP